MNPRRTLAALLLAAPFTFPAMAKDLFPDNKPIKFEFLEKSPSTDTIGGYPVINLGNDLGLFYLRTFFSNLNHPLGRLAGVDIRDGKFFASLDITANLSTVSSSDWTDEPCKSKNFLWKKSTGGAFSNINCATISYATNYFKTPTGEFQQALVRFREAGIEFPPTVLLVQFTRYADSGRRLVYKATINPEMFGIERDAEPMWGANSWHASFIQKDPKKVEFVANLSKWAEDVQSKMNDAFDKKPDAFASLPAFESYFKK